MIRCLIIDDEPLARRLLRDHASKIPELQVVAEFPNPGPAMKSIMERKIDLMFLDIQMPEITGVDFLRSLKEKPLTIFTTAYPDYALQGYELDVIDYLLKPIPFGRFRQAVDKAIEYLKYKGMAGPGDGARRGSSCDEGYFFVKSEYRIVRINFKDVLFVEGLKEYVGIHTDDKRIVTHLSMKKIEEILPSERFFRIHKSYIVNLQKIVQVDKGTVNVGGKSIPMSRDRRAEFLKAAGGSPLK